MSLNLLVKERGVLKDKVVGRDVFIKFYKGFQKRASIIPKPSNSEVIEFYKKYFEQTPNNLGHTFRIMLQMIGYIDSQKLSFQSKKHYVDIVKVQLTTYELVLLYYNVLAIEEFRKYEPILESYFFFDNLDRKMLIVTSERLF